MTLHYLILTAVSVDSVFGVGGGSSCVGGDDESGGDLTCKRKPLIYEYHGDAKWDRVS